MSKRCVFNLAVGIVAVAAVWCLMVALGQVFGTGW